MQMDTSQLRNEVDQIFDGFSLAQQTEALSLLRSFASSGRHLSASAEIAKLAGLGGSVSPPLQSGGTNYEGVPFESFSHLIGTLPDDLADEMEKAIEDCERIDRDEW